MAEALHTGGCMGRPGRADEPCMHGHAAWRADWSWTAPTSLDVRTLMRRGIGGRHSVSVAPLARGRTARALEYLPEALNLICEIHELSGDGDVASASALLLDILHGVAA